MVAHQSVFIQPFVTRRSKPLGFYCSKVRWILGERQSLRL